MSATTFLTRKEETSTKSSTQKRVVEETIIYWEDGSDFALEALSLTGDCLRAVVELPSLLAFAKATNNTDLEDVLVEELERSGLEETLYEVEIDYCDY